MVGQHPVPEGGNISPTRGAQPLLPVPISTCLSCLMEPARTWRWAVQGAGCLHRFGNAFPGIEARRMRTGKLGEAAAEPGVDRRVSHWWRGRCPSRSPAGGVLGHQELLSWSWCWQRWLGPCWAPGAEESPQPWEGRAGFHRLPHRALLGQPGGRGRAGAGLGAAGQAGRKPGLWGLLGLPEPALEDPQLPALPSPFLDSPAL